MARRTLLIFGLKVLAWLPLMFFGWFGLAEGISALVVYLAGQVFAILDPEILVSVVRDGMEVNATIRLPEGAAHSHGNFNTNTMQFGYGLPLYAALAMVPPASGRVLLLRLAAGFLLVVAIQVWAVTFYFLYVVHVQMAMQIPQFQLSNLLAEAFIIASSRLGIFILPPLLPLLLWAALHRGFLATLLAPKRLRAG